MQYPDILTTEQAAKYLQVDVKTIRGLCQVNRIPHRKVGRIYRFSRAALDAWIAGEGPPEHPFDASFQGIRRSPPRTLIGLKPS